MAQELERDPPPATPDSDVVINDDFPGPLMTSLVDGMGRLMENLPQASDEEMVEVVDMVAAGWVSVEEGGSLLAWRVPAVVRGVKVEAESGGLLTTVVDPGMVGVGLLRASGEDTMSSNVLSGVLSASSISSCARDTDRCVPYVNTIRKAKGLKHQNDRRKSRTPNGSSPVLNPVIALAAHLKMEKYLTHPYVLVLGQGAYLDGDEPFCRLGDVPRHIDVSSRCHLTIGKGEPEVNMGMPSKYMPSHPSYPYLNAVDL